MGARTDLFDRLYRTADLILEGYARAETDGAMSMSGFICRNLHCDGSVMMMTWEVPEGVTTSLPSHAHEGYERFGVSLGEAYVKTDALEAVLHVGDSIAFQPGQAHTTTVTGPAKGWSTTQPPDYSFTKTLRMVGCTNPNCPHWTECRR